MCTTCGCSGERHPHAAAAHGHEHPGGDHPHRHHHGPAARARTLRIEQEILAGNEREARRNREWLAERAVTAWNLIGAPGAGKTALLERTIRDLAGELEISVIEGDQATARDAERIAAAGARVVQINTGSGCHLDAAMVGGALRQLDPSPRSVVLVENVGNLVCPALFDLGEREKVVIASVTEGEDKPLKYPHVFRASALLLLTKVDLIPHLDFDVDQCLTNARRASPRLEVARISARSGEGMATWYEHLRRGARSAAAEARGGAAAPR